MLNNFLITKYSYNMGKYGVSDKQKICISFYELKSLLELSNLTSNKNVAKLLIYLD